MRKLLVVSCAVALAFGGCTISGPGIGKLDAATFLKSVQTRGACDQELSRFDDLVDRGALQEAEALWFSGIRLDCPGDRSSDARRRLDAKVAARSTSTPHEVSDGKSSTTSPADVAGAAATTPTPVREVGEAAAQTPTPAAEAETPTPAAEAAVVAPTPEMSDPERAFVARREAALGAFPRGEDLRRLCETPKGTKKVRSAHTEAERSLRSGSFAEGAIEDGPIPGWQDFFESVLTEVSGREKMTGCVLAISDVLEFSLSNRYGHVWDHLNAVRRQDEVAAAREFKSLPVQVKRGHERAYMTTAEQVAFDRRQKATEAAATRARLVGSVGHYRTEADSIGQAWCQWYRDLALSRADGGICLRAGQGGPAWVACNEVQTRGRGIEARKQRLLHRAFTEVGTAAHAAVAEYVATYYSTCDR